MNLNKDIFPRITAKLNSLITKVKLAETQKQPLKEISLIILKELVSVMEILLLNSVNDQSREMLENLVNS